MTTRYGIKEYLKEYREALEQKPEPSQTGTQAIAKPNRLQLLKGKKEQASKT